MAEPGWAIPWDDDGKPITLVWHGIEDLTVSRLRRWKQWYGPDYGKAYTANLLFLQADVDAVACVIWECLRERSLEPGSTVKCPESPNMLPDFSVGAVAGATVHEPDPTLEVDGLEIPLTQDSTETLTISEEKPLGGSRSTGARRRSPTS